MLYGLSLSKRGEDKVLETDKIVLLGLRYGSYSICEHSMARSSPRFLDDAIRFARCGGDCLLRGSLAQTQVTVERSRG